MTELTELNLQSVLNSPDYRLTTEVNFNQVQEAIDLLQSSFGIQFDPNPTIDSQNSTFTLNILKSNNIKLPATGATKINLDGNNGGVTASSINVTKNSYVGGDILLYNSSGIDGRIKFGVDKVNDQIKSPEVGQIRFTGGSFQGYAIQNETSSKFSFTIGSSGSGDAVIYYNGSAIVTVGWQGTAYQTANRIVSEIAAISDPTNLQRPAIKASSSVNTVTIESLPGFASIMNGISILVTAPGMTLSASAGTMSGGVDGTKGWVDFNGAQAGQVISATTSNILAIPYPQQGMIRFSTDDSVLAIYDGSDWIKLSSSGILS